MGSQPPLLSGFECLKLGLIEIKGSTSPLRQGDPQTCARKSEVCHLNESSIDSLRVAVEGTVPVSLSDKPREDFILSTMCVKMQVKFTALLRVKAKISQP